MLPKLAGRPVQVRMVRSLGRHLAATSIPRRVILLDREVLEKSGDFERILIHEIFHFAWLRLSNATRQSWELALRAEMSKRVPGELGWSAELRKSKLTRAHVTTRAIAWRRYACESFCDTAAWLFAGLRRHPEFTLPSPHRRRRQAWFQRTFPADAPIPI